MRRSTRMVPGARAVVARPGARRFVLHVGQMLLAMTAGMVLLAPVASLLVPDLDHRPGLHVMTMAADMAIGMGLWMGIRGHDRRMITEMSAAMTAPFALLLGPCSAGWLSASTLSMLGHAVMVVAMVAVMVARRGYYSQPQHVAWPSRRTGTPRHAVTAHADR